ncbi:MAG: CopG family transcriptional regulator [Armatimonadetes bacterium]|nr:CopG family transcriptional regulator [Armatimonadota bacterium]
MKAREFDKRFDQGEDVTDALDVAAARRPLQTMRRVNVDSPPWMVESLDREAARLGVTRQSLIKIWIVERLEQPALQAGRRLVPGRPPAAPRVSVA